MRTEIPWAHLPNAVHIDRILASVKENPEKWDAARSARSAARDAYTAARSAAYTAARSAARIAAYTAAYTAARSAVVAWEDAVVAQDAVAALVAWDDCAYMLDMPEDALKVLRAVGSQPAVLLSVAAKVLRAENI
jgi:hypothetical protein